MTEYFNAFHDGFVRRLTVLSRDEFEDIGVHALAGPLDLEIEFAHYNYGQGAPPAERCILARFAGVRCLHVEFTGAESDWPIKSFELDESATNDGSFFGRLTQARLIDGAWSDAEAMSFCFDTGVLRELPDASTGH